MPTLVQQSKRLARTYHGVKMSNDKLKSWDEVNDWGKLMAYKPNPLLRFIWRTERILRMFHPRRLFNRLIKYPYQRLSRGFSDQDAWSGNEHLAKQIAGILRWNVKHSYGIGYPYVNNDLPVDEAALIRDMDYEKKALLFDEFAENGIALDTAWKKKHGGLSNKEYKDLMKWFADIFPALWD